ncbi:MAG: hydroxyacid dehydrogenase [Flavobacteriaceae bacterium]|jgi:D-3-phosphoglycerate dehydrogenase / 2-oxoglutarate reductase|nr:hydroxyacid dehydrogenase [Flavobacteriaceae bacterium]
MIKILVITPTSHLKSTRENLESIGQVHYLENATITQFKKVIPNFDAIFTNPNKSNIFLGKNALEGAKKLKVICTASTGTNHVDKKYLISKGIQLISITEERNVIRKISSTAEHAFALTLTSLRNIIPSYNSVKNGEWDYVPFIGRQISNLTFGVIGYGRLGSLYSDYCLAFGSKVIVYDPYKTVYRPGVNQVDNLESLLSESDVISLHVHVNEETTNLINCKTLKYCKNDVLIVNSSRGEIVNEKDLIDFLKLNFKSKYSTDVLANETFDRKNSEIYSHMTKSNQIIITPHIAGMTYEAQEMAFNHASKLLIKYFKKNESIS